MHQTLEKAAESKVLKKKEIINTKLQEDLICQEVLDRIGPLSNLHQIRAHNVFDNKWRVNVWLEVWKDESVYPEYKIGYSYFCTVQDNCIFKSDPELPVKF